MTAPCSLTFALDFKSAEFANLTLPIEVRKPNMALVKRAVSSETIEVEPGTYYVTAILPAGQELMSQIDVAAGEHKSVKLTPEPEDESPHENHEVQHFMVRETRGDDTSQLEGLGSSNSEARVVVFRGNVLQGKLEDVSQEVLNPPSYPETGIAQIKLNSIDQPQLVQLLQTNAPPLNVAVPGWVNSRANMILMRLPDGTLAVDMHLEHKVADLLCHYRAQNLFEQVAVTVNSPGQDAEHLLQEKIENPIAATVGAYALLRIGSLDKLHDWTENLKNWFPWLPDGLTVRGEHHARIGEHDQALDLFLQLPSRGLPIFSAGLLYAFDRLQYYIKLGAEEFDAGKIEQAKTVVNRLQQFATYVDFGKPVLSYPGLDPLKPENKPLTDLPPEKGLDVSQFLT